MLFGLVGRSGAKTTPVWSFAGHLCQKQADHTCSSPKLLGCLTSSRSKWISHDLFHTARLSSLGELHP